MMRSGFVLCVLVGLLSISASFPVSALDISNPSDYQNITAIAHALLRSNVTDGSNITGVVTFEQDGTSGMVRINISIHNLARRDVGYAMHVHRYGILTSAMGPFGYFPPNAGGHFNPNNTAHACYPTPIRHVGDIGSVWKNTSDTATTDVMVSELMTLTGPNSIIGRSIVLHSNSDDCSSSNFGYMLANGVIGRGNANGNAAIDRAGPDTTLLSNSSYGFATVFGPGNTTEQEVIYGTLAFANVILTDGTPAVRINGSVKVPGVNAGDSRGWHIHTYGDLTTNMTSGGHFQVQGQSHGLPPTAQRHYGDLGNVTADETGRFVIDTTFGTELISIQDLKNGILGRTIAFHQHADTGSTSSFGDRLALGVIGLVPLSTFATTPAPTTPVPTTVTPTTPVPTNDTATTPVPTTETPTSPPTNATATTAVPTTVTPTTTAPTTETPTTVTPTTTAPTTETPTTVTPTTPVPTNATATTPVPTTVTPTTTAPTNATATTPVPTTVIPTTIAPTTPVPTTVTPTTTAPTTTAPTTSAPTGGNTTTRAPTTATPTTSAPTTPTAAPPGPEFGGNKSVVAFPQPYGKVIVYLDLLNPNDYKQSFADATANAWKDRMVSAIGLDITRLQVLFYPSATPKPYVVFQVSGSSKSTIPLNQIMDSIAEQISGQNSAFTQSTLDGSIYFSVRSLYKQTPPTIYYFAASTTCDDGTYVAPGVSCAPVNAPGSNPTFGPLSSDNWTNTYQIYILIICVVLVGSVLVILLIYCIHRYRSKDTVFNNHSTYVARETFDATEMDTFQPAVVTSSGAATPTTAGAATPAEPSSPAASPTTAATATTTTTTAPTAVATSEAKESDAVVITVV